MEKDIDRIEFYENLKNCKSNKDVEELIENIDNEDLYSAMLDKYNRNRYLISIYSNKIM